MSPSHLLTWVSSVNLHVRSAVGQRAGLASPEVGSRVTGTASVRTPDACRSRSTAGAS